MSNNSGAPAQDKKKVFGTLAFVFGLIGLILGVLGFIPLLGLIVAYIAGILAVLAIIFGIVGKGSPTNGKKATIGLVFGIITIVLVVAAYLVNVYVYTAAATNMLQNTDWNSLIDTTTNTTGGSN